jgi:hypothetical protein
VLIFVKGACTQVLQNSERDVVLVSLMKNKPPEYQKQSIPVIKVNNKYLGKF